MGKTKKVDENGHPGPPEHLSERSKALWMELMPTRNWGTGRLVTFLNALECLDLADAAREARTKEGLTITTQRSGVTHANPLLKVERENRALFIKTWAMLGLNSDYQSGTYIDSPFGPIYQT